MKRARTRRQRRARRRGLSRRRSTHRRRIQRGGASIVHTNPTSPFKVFMCANKSKPTLEALMKSLEDHGFSYEVLAYRMPWENLRAKVEWYLKGAEAYEKAAGPDALAIFVDGFDVICIQDASVMLEKYKARKRNMPILFSAEEYCLGNCNKGVVQWYDYHKIRGGSKAVLAKVEKINGETGDLAAKEPTFMNTGFLVGPVGEIRSLYKGILETPYVIDDQYTAGEYVQKHFDKIDLDLEEQFIRTKISVLDKKPDEGTKEGPVFLHFPGHRDDQQQATLLTRYAEQYGVKN